MHTDKDFYASLKRESNIVMSLQLDTSIPAVHDSGEYIEEDGHTYYFLAMDFLGLNLRELMNRNIEGYFSVRTTLHMTT